jgi:acyl carrier protein phosphodiesterase
MKKQTNKYSLKKYLEHLKIDIDRKLPCDVVEFSNQEYYSTSKKQYLKYKDMDLIHVLRSLLKDRKYLEIREELLMNRNLKLQDKYNKLARVFNELER